MEGNKTVFLQSWNTVHELFQEFEFKYKYENAENNGIIVLFIKGKISDEDLKKLTIFFEFHYSEEIETFKDVHALYSEVTAEKKSKYLRFCDKLKVTNNTNHKALQWIVRRNYKNDCDTTKKIFRELFEWFLLP